jgi:hypothetical protein
MLSTSLHRSSGEGALMRKRQTIIYLVGGALVLVSSFTITLWLTEPEVSPAEKVKLLAASAVSDEATLSAAASAVGLRRSPNVKGHVDVLNRIDATSVTMLGWATEIPSVAKSSPIIVMAFTDGKSILRVEAPGCGFRVQLIC